MPHVKTIDPKTDRLRVSCGDEQDAFTPNHHHWYELPAGFRARMKRFNARRTRQAIRRVLAEIPEEDLDPTVLPEWERAGFESEAAYERFLFEQSVGSRMGWGDEQDAYERDVMGVS